MASDSSTSTATTPEKPLENKVNEEANLMEKEIGSSEKESLSLVEEVGAVVKAEESTETEKQANSEKGAEKVELKEPNLVKEGVAEVNGKAGVAEKAEEKPNVEKVVEENSKDKEEIVDAPELAYESGGKQAEPVDVQSVKDVSAETAEEKIKDVEALEVELKPEVSEKVETQPEKVKELAPEIEVVMAEDKPETTEHAKVELQAKLEDVTVEAKESGNSKDEKTSESGTVLCPEEIVLTKQGSDPKKEVEEDASFPADVIEKAITEEKHVVDEPSKDEKPSESGAALSPEEIVSTTNKESGTGPKDETEGDASSPVDVVAITEEKHVVNEPPKDEKTSEPAAALCPEKVVPTNQDPDTNPKEEIEGGASSPVDVTEKAITEEKHAVDEPLKDGTASLCPETVVPSNQDSETSTKEKTEGDASTADDVIEKAITEEKHVVDEPSKNENPSESGPALRPENAVPTNPKKESERDISSLADIIENEKAITKEKHVVEEPSKDEQETVHKGKDLGSILATEDENIKKDTADGKSKETSKETDTESREKETAATKQEETITAQEAEVVETAPVVKESDEPKQQPEEVTAKEVPVKQKHSNSIISKVKQSLVKAKKAIIGKSPSSKTITTEEAKEEIKVK